MEQNLGFLFAAFTVTWIGIFAYVFFMQRTLSDTLRRLTALEQEEQTELNNARP